MKINLDLAPVPLSDLSRMAGSLAKSDDALKRAVAAEFIAAGEAAEDGRPVRPRSFEVNLDRLSLEQIKTYSAFFDSLRQSCWDDYRALAEVFRGIAVAFLGAYLDRAADVRRLERMGAVDFPGDEIDAWTPELPANET